jgi:simple sugar transport system permease protein
VLAIAMPFVVAALWVLLRRTRFGLRLAACGEHPFAARSVGIDPSRMRLIALVLGGVLCALGGAELALGSLQLFSVGMTAGRGFMAFAAVIFGASNPLGAAAAATFFSLVEYLGIKAQLVLGHAAPPELILSLPYIATVAGVWLSSRIRGGAAESGISELREF